MSTPPTPPPLRTNEPDPASPIPASVPRVPGTGYLECDFCHCRLTTKPPVGQVYEMSPEAYAFRDEKENHAKAIGKLDEEIAALRSQIAAKDAEIATLKGSPTRGSKQKFL